MIIFPRTNCSLTKQTTISHRSKVLKDLHTYSWELRFSFWSQGKSNKTQTWAPKLKTLNCSEKDNDNLVATDTQFVLLS